jgi:hypothetical protein
MGAGWSRGGRDGTGMHPWWEGCDIEARQGATTLVGLDGLDEPPGLAVPRAGPARHEGY